LGLTFEMQAGNPTAPGLRVQSVESVGPAAQAGIRANDSIVSIDGRQFRNGRQAEVYLGAQAGRPVPVLIERGGQQMMVQVVPVAGEEDSAWIGVLLEASDQMAGRTGNAPNPSAPAPGQPADRNTSQGKGARVSQVYPGGPGARAGLRPGDSILKVNGQAVDDPADLIVTIHDLKPQSRADLVLLRNGQEMQIPVTLGSRRSFVTQAGFREGPFQPGGQDFRGPAPGPGQEFGQGPPAILLEHDRHQAEQHQRIEEELRKLREEVAKLREQIQRNQGSR